MLNSGMALKQTRILRLSMYLNAELDGNGAELARVIERSPSFVNDVLHERKSFGEKLARHIEGKIGKPVGWLDVDPAAPPKGIAAVSATTRELAGLSKHAAMLTKVIREQDKAGALPAAIAEAVAEILKAWPRQTVLMAADSACDTVPYHRKPASPAKPKAAGTSARRKPASPRK